MLEPHESTAKIGTRSPGVLVCLECRAESEGKARGWCAYLADGFADDGLEPLVSFYCPDCAAREFR